MAHQEQKDFCLKVKKILPQFFSNKIVLDVGSLDINGNNKYLFNNCSYCGIDVGEGPNVDVVTKTHEYLSLPGNIVQPGSFDVIISTECFEHDMYYHFSLQTIVKLLKSGGLFLFTCATEGRPEHGTLRTSPADAPLLANYGEWSNYYKNLTELDIRKAINLNMTEVFTSYSFEVNTSSHDLYFWGIKK